MRGKRIGIDVRALTPPLSGAGVALREILTHLARLDPEVAYYCYTTRAAAGENLPPGRFHLRVGRGLTARWGTIWFQTGIGSYLKEDDLDLFWGPLQILPLVRAARKLPMVLTIHDLVFRYYPETMSWRNRVALARYVQPSLGRAQTILTASQATADALGREFGIDPHRVQVIHYAASDRFRPQGDEEARRLVGEKYGVVGPYLLFVGTLEPRKNLDGLLTALGLLVAQNRFDGQVLIVGAEGWNMAPLLRSIRGGALEPRLHFTGYVDEADLPHLYSAARLFVMPSHYEGFGLPVLEAMGCGTPVLCADSPPFPEITQGAACLAAARDGSVFAEALAQLWSETDLRRELVSRGLRRARDFSWDRTARGIYECFEGVLQD